jgi:hypothetical protein
MAILQQIHSARIMAWMSTLSIFRHKYVTLFLFTLLLLPLIIVIMALGSSNPPEPVWGIEELYRLDLLPCLKQSTYVGSVSSYDRSGGNDDGFSGKYSFVRKEPDGLVLADLKGPGIIYRLWTPTPSNDWLDFYFDGEASPRIHIKFRELFMGTQPPFLEPLVGSGAGGYFSYLPLPFRKSCKVLIRAGKMQFYQINYALYPESVPFETFSPKLSSSQSEALEQACKLWAEAGEDISRFGIAAGEDLQQCMVSRKTLLPGKSVTLFEIDQPGRIAGFRLGPANLLAGEDRAILLKIYWDGEVHPAVLCPVGDFFGYSWGEPAMKSLLLGTSENMNYCYFPMPFDHSARIELVSEDQAAIPIELQAELATGGRGRDPQEGRFYSFWHRENPIQDGKPFTFLEVEGQGQLVGCILEAQGLESGATPFFEGDDQTELDGQLAIHGTGSEDFFNGGWYDVPDRWEERKSFPLSGCLDYLKPLARSAGYRFMITDSYVYQKSLRQTIEHGPEKNNVPADYCGVTFFYSLKPPSPSATIPPLAERKVVDLQKFKYSPGWNIPIHSFALQNVTLTKKTENLEGTEVRYLDMQVNGDDLFGEPSISFAFDIPVTGIYLVELEALRGPDQGQVQLFRNERPAGDKVDLFYTIRERSALLSLGTLPLNAGRNHLFFKIMGKNPLSKGLGFQPVTFIFSRVY